MIFREPIFCRRVVYKVEAGLKSEVRVALTGDWHVSRITSDKQLKFLKNRLKEINPDVIILQGDLFDTPKSFLNTNLVSRLKKNMKLCAKIAPTVMVIGNHDQIDFGNIVRETHAEFLARVFPDIAGEWRKICRETGVKLLVNNWFEIKGLRIFGFYQDPEMYYCKSGVKKENFPEMKRKIKQLTEDGEIKFSNGKAHWFAAHAPIDELYKMRELAGFNVFSFGHTHGGCVPVGIDAIEDLCHGHWGLVAPFQRLFPARFMRGREIVNKNASYIVNTGMVLVQDGAPKPLQYLNFIKAAEITEVIVK